MGKVLIDGSPCEVAIPSDASMVSAFEVARDSVADSGRVVVEVEINNRRVVWEDGANEWAAPFTNSDTISIHTDDPVRMSVSLLNRIIDRLPAITSAHRQAAATLRSGDIPTGVAQVLEVMPWWQDLLAGIVNICKLQNIKVDEEPWRSIGLGEIISKLQEQLNEFHLACTVQDYVLLADLLDYEFAPLADQWKSVCTAFRQELQGKPASKEAQ